MKKITRRSILAAAPSALALTALSVRAEKQYGPGVTDTEIKLGQTMPYSGPASSFSLVGRVMTGYFKMLNEEQGGINGRKVTLLSLDDAFSPPKAVEQTRQLVERDGVFAIAGSFGSPSNLAIAKYLNTQVCPECNGTRLRREARHVKVADRTIHDPVVARERERRK